MKKTWPGLSILFALACAPFPANALSSHSYTIAIDAVANGGGTVSSASYGISHLTGQPLVIGPVSSTGYTVQGGFYYIHLLEELLAKRATCLIIDGSTLYAGFYGSGVWKSADGGANWTAATKQPANMHVKGLVIHPTIRSTLYAATYGGGVYTSTNSGDTWTACANGGLGGAALNAVSLAMDPSGTLYAGTEGGIFKSPDCFSWSDANTGLTIDAAMPPVAIAIDATAPTTLYAGFDGSGIYRSTNSGGSWTAAAMPAGNLRIKTLAQHGSALYAGSYGNGVLTSTTGESWSYCAGQPANLNVVSLTIDANGKIYAGTEGGVFASADGCGTWMAINSGLP